MRNVRVGYRYAKALVELAHQAQQLDAVKQDLDMLRALRHKELEAVIASPIVRGETKAKIFRAIFGKTLHPLTLSFFDLVFRKGREFALRDIARAFDQRFDERKSIVRARVAAAIPLSQTLREELHQRLARLPFVQGKTLQLETDVDSSIIGGLIIYIGDKKADASVWRQLQITRQDFIENLYQMKF